MQCGNWFKSLLHHAVLILVWHLFNSPDCYSFFLQLIVTKMKRIKPMDLAKKFIDEDRDQEGLEKRHVSSEIGE
jgi:hypothetical protein